MINKNDILKKYIINKYGSVGKFLKKTNFPPYQLETVLQKDDIFHEISIGVKICAFLNIDARRLFCGGEIVELDKPDDGGLENLYENLSVDELIKIKYLNLSEDDRKKAADFADYIFENGDGNG